MINLISLHKELDAVVPYFISPSPHSQEGEETKKEKKKKKKRESHPRSPNLQLTNHISPLTSLNASSFPNVIRLHHISTAWKRFSKTKYWLGEYQSDHYDHMSLAGTEPAKHWLHWTDKITIEDYEQFTSTWLPLSTVTKKPTSVSLHPKQEVRVVDLTWGSLTIIGLALSSCLSCMRHVPCRHGGTFPSEACPCGHQRGYDLSLKYGCINVPGGHNPPSSWRVDLGKLWEKSSSWPHVRCAGWVNLDDEVAVCIKERKKKNRKSRIHFPVLGWSGGEGGGVVQIWYRARFTLEVLSPHFSSPLARPYGTPHGDIDNLVCRPYARSD